MNKQEINKGLQKQHDLFFKLMKQFSHEAFGNSREDKWSPHQNLEHIKRAVQPLAIAYHLPKWVIKLIVGKSNRPSKTYEELVLKYISKLNAGGRASGRFIPPKKIKDSREKLISQTGKYLKSIQKAVENKWTEEQLDTYVFPHPLLGKLTAREMLYFTIYHAQHHKETVEKYYGRH